LLSEHLIEEIPAQGTLPVWHRDDNKGALALRITERGLAAIGADQDGAAAKADEAHPSEQMAKRGRRGPQPRSRGASSDRKLVSKARKPVEAGRAESKQAAVIAMLQGRQCSSLAKVGHGEPVACEHALALAFGPINTAGAPGSRLSEMRQRS